MSRRLVTTFFIALAVAAVGCKSGDGGAGVSDDQPAGEVTELAGKVTATRGGKTRTLAQGQQVFGNDLVSTTKGASVAVRLFHNGAVWRIEGGKKRVLKKTAAWRAPKGGGSGLARGAGTDETAAAGRHGERSAVDTRGTARMEEPAAAAPMAADMDTEAPPPPPAAATGAPGAAPAKAMPKKAPARVTAAEVARNVKRARASSSSASRAAQDAERARARRVLDSLKKKSAAKYRMKGGAANTAGGGGSTELAPGLGLGGVGPGGGGGETAGGAGTIGRGAMTIGSARKSEKKPTTRVVVMSGRADGALSQEIVRRIIMRRYLRSLKACYEKSLTRDPSLKGVLDLRFTIAASGRVSKVVIAGTITDKDMRGCVASRVKRMRFPAAKDNKSTDAIQRVAFKVP